MAQNIIETIFNSKNNLNDFYPQFPGVNFFDLERKHLLYGRIDAEGDAVYLDDSNLKQLNGGRTGTHLAVDFVCKAFSDLGKNIKGAANKGYVSKDSLFPTNVIAYKSWKNGDLEFSYNAYLDKIYETFVNSYLSVDRRADKIKNFKDFTKEFLRFAIRTAKYFPITKTGFLTSIHCSPFVSGLMIEVAPERHGVASNAAALNYVNDVSFSFFVNEVKKFGFMVDKNAPWRIVFNLASGEDERKKTGNLAGGQKYMQRFAVNYGNVFQTYYRKAFLDEHLTLQNKIKTFYEAFYYQFSTYEEVQYVVCEKGQPLLQPSFSINHSVLGRVKRERKDRETPGVVQGTEKEVNEYWIRVLLKLRMAETETHHTAHNFNFYAREAVRLSRIFSLEAALRYINDLTKGLHVIKFLNKGAYWYGISDEEYEQRKLEIKQNAQDPSLVNYSLTATKNII